MQKGGQKKISQRLAQLSLENASETAFWLEEDGGIFNVNDAACRSLGYSRQELLEMSISDFSPLNPANKWKARSAAIIEAGSGNFESIHQHKDGSTFPVWVSVNCTSFEGREFLFALVRDISRQKRFEMELIHEKEFNESAFNALTDTLYVFQPNTGKALRWNKQFEVVSGYSAEEIAEMKAPGSWYDKADQVKAANALQAVFNGGTATVELSLITKSGKRVPTEYSASPIAGSDPPVVIAIGRDVSGRRIAEETLKNSEVLLNETGRLAKIGGWTLKLPNMTAYFTKETYRIHGLPLNSPPTLEEGLRFFAPEAQPVITDAVSECIKHGTPYSLEVPFITAKNEHIWVHAKGRAHFDGKKIVRLSGTLQDITARKIAEETIETQLQFERLLSELAAALVNTSYTEIDAEIEKWQKKLVQFLGIQRCDISLISDDKKHFSIAHSYAAPRFASDEGLIINKALPWFYEELQKGEMLILENLPESLPKEASSEKTYCENHGIKAVLSIPFFFNEAFFGAVDFIVYTPFSWPESLSNRLKILSDILFNAILRKKGEQELESHKVDLKELVKARTLELQNEIEERKKTERELHVAKEAAESASRAKSDFLAGMSHELRTPLNAIIGYGQILQKEANLTKKQKQELSTIHSSGQHLLALINDILDFGKIEAQKLSTRHEDFNLHFLLQNMYDITRLKAVEKDLFLNFEELSEIPEIVRGDERCLKQIILNLLSNAVKYTYTGGVTLKYGYLDSSPGSFFLEVIDTGVGIPKDRIDIVFDPFTQYSDGNKYVEGTGLGLPISLSLTKLLKGKLSVHSNTGKGSRFSVQLPLPVVRVKAEKKTRKEMPGDARITGYKGKQIRVLIVDNSASNRNLLTDLMSPLNFVVDTAGSGEIALQKAAEIPPDLMVLDYLMPHLDGRDVAARLKDTTSLVHIPIIGISATSGNEDRKKEFLDLCDDYSPKPIDADAFLELVRSQLNLVWVYEVVPKKEPPPLFNEDSAVPGFDVLEKIAGRAKLGDYNSLELILDRLCYKESPYLPFCHHINSLIETYDEESIVEYIDDLKGREK
ncbi:MAG: PAS domain S-box protein [bacterium]|nr:PAS domain S-box protein [bacterium]